MDSYQSMINERKRREMEAEMNRFEQEISSRPVFDNLNPPTSVHFIPHQIQRQLPRNPSIHNPMQPTFDSQHHQNFIMSGQTSQTGLNGQQMNFTISPMAVPGISHQTTIGSTQNPNTNNTNTSKKSKNTSGEKSKKVKKMLRMAGGSVWEDNTLLEWSCDDFRIFCGDLGNDVTDDVLSRAFNRFSSFTKAKVVRDKRTNKSKGYGFVSFKDPQDFARAIKEMNGKYVGSRPIKLRKSMWKERNYDVVKKKIKTKAKLGLI